jgi:23S rRNA pseudouridine1911/1915/1917 synthase
VLEEDEVIAVVNKPAGMVVHPGRGHWSGTLASALAHHFNALSTTAGSTRPGIVHRLDRDTSGVLIVAKNDSAHEALAAQFKARTVEKEYLAIVVGGPDRDRDRIVGPIGAHPTQRTKMAIRAGHATSRDAETFFEVAERFAGFALVRAFPKTGRTHQIRLHLASIGCAVLCDRLYGGRARITRDELRKGAGFRVQGSESSDPSRSAATPEACAPGAAESSPVLARHALHAHRLSLNHPTTGERREFIAPLPEDMQNVLDLLRQADGERPA